ncbi:aspartyl-phosphate phosphatase Spo0E family protein [Brevibacillus laterosporus]|uniref:Aspartyl-phosphate phosphatase Spo0E family protein n=1 Tax=Brevibacillus laterosporus TaxID=1465 RepID=A0A518VFC8_BRELA|nr:aspartyl-phosphate phosphatase Spo0E family protein [Brevibacillus laterosporus]
MPQPHSKGTPSSKSLHYATTTLSQNDCDLQQATETLEALRHKLVKLFCREGSFSSPEVLQMSRQLDEYIVAIQKRSKLTENYTGCRL